MDSQPLKERWACRVCWFEFDTIEKRNTHELLSHSGEE